MNCKPEEMFRTLKAGTNPARGRFTERGRGRGCGFSEDSGGF